MRNLTLFCSAPRLGYIFTPSRHATMAQQYTRGVGEPSATPARLSLFGLLVFCRGKVSSFNYRLQVCYAVCRVSTSTYVSTCWTHEPVLCKLSSTVLFRVLDNECWPVIVHSIVFVSHGYTPICFFLQVPCTILAVLL